MLHIIGDINIREHEIEEHFIRASGPGGQNINKVSSAVQLRFAAMTSNSLPYAVRHRLKKLAGRRMTAEGVLIIEARRYRSQERNRQDAIERLTDLIRKATVKPKVRRKTRPSAASRERKQADKKHRSALKKLRRRVRDDQE